jgi:hypothetical protein
MKPIPVHPVPAPSAKTMEEGRNAQGNFIRRPDNDESVIDRRERSMS